MKTKATMKVVDLTSRAMLISLSIGYWTGKTTDDSAADEISTKHHAEKDVPEVRRRLCKKEELKEFKGVRSRAREYLKSKTSPWIDGGTRILPSPLFDEVTTKLKGFETEWDAAVAKFKRRWPTIKAGEKKRQGSMYREEDMPTEAQLDRKFSWSRAIFPIPARADFRVELSKEQVGEVQDQIDAKIREALEIATRDLWSRLHEVVKKLAEKMAEADPTFRDSIIENIREIVALLPTLNVANDPKLEEMRKAVDEQLAKLNPEELREDATARKKTKDAADKLLATMSAYLGNGS